MKKIIVLVTISMLVLFNLCSCNKTESDKSIIKVGLLSSETAVNSQYIEITADNVIKSGIGIRLSDDLTDDNFLTDATFKTKTLNKKEINLLNDTINKLETVDFTEEPQNKLDAGGVVLYIKGDEYRFYYNDTKNKQLKELVDLLIRLSPMEIIKNFG